MVAYALVMAMMVCALVAVLIALAAEESELGRPRQTSSPVWAVLGASDAIGEGTANPSRDNWVSRLRSELPNGVVVYNFGASGSTLAEARRLQLPRALAARPDVVTCWLAVNDIASGVSLQEYERDLAKLLIDLKEGESHVILGNVPNLALVPAFAGSPSHAEALRREAEQWNNAIATIASAHGADLVDLFGEQLLAEDFGPDGFHPSPSGHRRLAGRFLPPVRRAIEAVSRSAGESTEAALSRAER